MGDQWVSRFQFIFFGIVLVATTCTCLGAQNSTPSCQEQERLALLKFKHSVKDDFKMLASWVGTECCLWKGVRCDGATGYVSHLRLKGNYRWTFGISFTEDYYIVGDKVSAYLADLKHLKHLDLSGNNFKGSRIPEFVGTFKQLSYLKFSNAGFSGFIPHHIGNLSNLKVLVLSPTPFSGWNVMANDMSWVSGLSSLKHLDLSEVDFFQAKNIYMVLHMIPSLAHLRLRGCRVTHVDLVIHLNSSSILPNIEHLDLSLNFLEGQFPHFLHNMTSLKFLDLSNYNLSVAWNSINFLNTIPSLLELHLSWCGLHNAPYIPTYTNYSAHSNIQYLDLSQNSIEGRFLSEITNMTSLRVLDLSLNSLNSSIPVMPNLLKLDVSYNTFEHIEFVGIWRQCHLKELRISGNYFGEEMAGPSRNTSECSKYALEMLDSDGNQLNGSIPESVGRLSNLRFLYLMSNSLTGSIPKALERLRSLEILDLSYNDLTGSIPTFHGKLTKLYRSKNQFSGSIPESLGRSTCLTQLLMDSNKLTGPIPASIGKLTSLEAFSVSSNFLNGNIPVSVGQLSKLEILDMSNNSLEGVVSEVHFASLSSLEYLDTTSNRKLIFNISREYKPPFQLRTVLLGSCNIAYGFPQWLQTQRKLEELVLSNASLYGLLPTWFRKMPIISYLDLSHNKLSGSLINLPLNGFTMSLLLQGNLFNGSIPGSVCKSTGLTLLDVSGNRLSGNIPHCVENLQQMSMLILSSNGLSGVLLSSLGNISSSLSWLKLNDNNFNGEIPGDLRNLRFLRVLDLGNNDFSGSIPRWIGENLTYLMVLRLHKNTFTGRIPQSLCKCSYLQILDVGHNSLAGSIPNCFGKLNGMIEKTRLDIRNGSSGSDENVIQVMKGMNLEYAKTLDLVFNMDLSSNKLTGQMNPPKNNYTYFVGGTQFVS